MQHISRYSGLIPSVNMQTAIHWQTSQLYMIGSSYDYFWWAMFSDNDLGGEVAYVATQIASLRWAHFKSGGVLATIAIPNP